MTTFYTLICAWALVVIVGGCCGVYLLYRQGEDKAFWAADIIAVVFSAVVLGWTLHLGGVI